MGMSPGLPQSSAAKGGRRLFVLIMLLVLVFACTPSQREEELRKEIQALKAQVAAMQEKLNQLQGGQQAIIGILKPAPSPPSSEAMVPPSPLGPEPLTVAQLLASKEQFLGTRVKVKGMVGPVMMHHKSLMLKGPQGMVEVLFGNLSDPKLIQTLNSTSLDKPITVTGMVTGPVARGTAAQLQINAEAVEF